MNDKSKKTLGILSKVVTWMLLAFTAFIIIFTIVTVLTVDKNDRNLFGYRFYIVQSDSMSLSENNKDLAVHFNAGDIVVIKGLSDSEKLTLDSGDIIAFVSTDKDSYLETVTHMIKRREYDKDGELLAYVTFGTNTGAEDKTPVTPEYILGVYSAKIPGAGSFFSFVKSVPGYIICVLIPFLILIGYNAYNVFRYAKKYREEQVGAIKAEREELSREREENKRMLEELAALKAELERKKSDGEPDTPDDSTEPKDPDSI